MARPEKVQAVADIKERLEGANAVFLAEYSGLSVKEQQELRRSLRAVAAEFKVVKMTLARRAAAELNIDLDDLLLGPTGLTFADRDPVEAAKALKDFASSHEALVVKGGLLGNDVLTPERVSALADIEPREVLLARLAGGFQAPMARLAGLVAALPRNMANAMLQLLDKKEEAQPAAPEAPEAAAPEPEAEAVSEPEPEAVEEPEPEAAVEPEAAEPEAAAEPEPEVVSEPEPEAAEPEAVEEPEPEAAVEPEAASEPEVVSEPEPEAAEPEAVEEPEPEAAVEPEAASEPEAAEVEVAEAPAEAEPTDAAAAETAADDETTQEPEPEAAAAAKEAEASDEPADAEDTVDDSTEEDD